MCQVWKKETIITLYLLRKIISTGNLEHKGIASVLIKHPLVSTFQRKKYNYYA